MRGILTPQTPFGVFSRQTAPENTVLSGLAQRKSLKNQPPPIALAVATLVPYGKPERRKKVLRGGHAEGTAIRSIAKSTVQNPFGSCSRDSGLSEDESGPFKGEVGMFGCRIFRAVSKGNWAFMRTESLITRTQSLLVAIVVESTWSRRFSTRSHFRLEVLYE